MLYLGTNSVGALSYNNLRGTMLVKGGVIGFTSGKSLATSFCNDNVASIDYESFNINIAADNYVNGDTNYAVGSTNHSSAGNFYYNFGNDTTNLYNAKRLLKNMSVKDYRPCYSLDASNNIVVNYSNAKVIGTNNAYFFNMFASVDTTKSMFRTCTNYEGLPWIPSCSLNGVKPFYNGSKNINTFYMYASSKNIDNAAQIEVNNINWIGIKTFYSGVPMNIKFSGNCYLFSNEIYCSPVYSYVGTSYNLSNMTGISKTATQSCFANKDSIFYLNDNAFVTVESPAYNYNDGITNGAFAGGSATFNNSDTAAHFQAIATLANKRLVLGNNATLNLSCKNGSGEFNVWQKSNSNTNVTPVISPFSFFFRDADIEVNDGAQIKLFDQLNSNQAIVLLTAPYAFANCKIKGMDIGKLVYNKSTSSVIDLASYSNFTTINGVNFSQYTIPNMWESTFYNADATLGGYNIGAERFNNTFYLMNNIYNCNLSVFPDAAYDMNSFISDIEANYIENSNISYFDQNNVLSSNVNCAPSNTNFSNCSIEFRSKGNYALSNFYCSGVNVYHYVNASILPSINGYSSNTNYIFGLFWYTNIINNTTQFECNKLAENANRWSSNIQILKRLKSYYLFKNCQLYNTKVNVLSVEMSNSDLCTWMNNTTWYVGNTPRHYTHIFDSYFENCNFEYGRTSSYRWNYQFYPDAARQNLSSNTTYNGCNFKFWGESTFTSSGTGWAIADGLFIGSKFTGTFNVDVGSGWRFINGFYNVSKNSNTNVYNIDGNTGYCRCLSNSSSSINLRNAFTDADIPTVDSYNFGSQYQSSVDTYRMFSNKYMVGLGNVSIVNWFSMWSYGLANESSYQEIVNQSINFLRNSLDNGSLSIGTFTRRTIISRNSSTIDVANSTMQSSIVYNSEYNCNFFGNGNEVYMRQALLSTPRSWSGNIIVNYTTPSGSPTSAVINNSTATYTYVDYIHGPDSNMASSRGNYVRLGRHIVCSLIRAKCKLQQLMMKENYCTSYNDSGNRYFDIDFSNDNLWNELKQSLLNM